eukprot:7062525-Prymnesium_polylepis.1
MRTEQKLIRRIMGSWSAECAMLYDDVRYMPSLTSRARSTSPPSSERMCQRCQSKPERRTTTRWPRRGSG